MTVEVLAGAMVIMALMGLSWCFGYFMGYEKALKEIE